MVLLVYHECDSVFYFGNQFCKLMCLKKRAISCSENTRLKLNVLYGTRMKLLKFVGDSL